MTTNTTTAPATIADAATHLPPAGKFFHVVTLADGSKVLVDTKGDTTPVLDVIRVGVPQIASTQLAQIEIDGVTQYVSALRIYNGLCGDCDGTGYRPGYGHSDGSRCWPCKYTGRDRARRYKTPTLATLRRSIARENAKQAALEAKWAEDARIAEAKAAAWKSANADLVAAAQSILDWRDADGDRMCTGYQYGLASEILSGLPRDKAIELFRAVAAEVEAKRAELAARVPVPTGKVEIVGELVSFKSNEWGLKMLVVDDRGFKVFGTFPVALDAADRGSRVAFVATVTPSGNDQFFGFFSRPSKCRVL